MLGMIRPSPSDQNVHIEQEFHQGKSTSISRTPRVVSGAVPGELSKIIAPVNSQRTRRSVPADGVVPVALRRRYSDRVVRSAFAKERIIRASSSLTLKVMVFTGNTVIP